MRFRIVPLASTVVVLVAVSLGCTKKEPFTHEPASTGSDPKVTLTVTFPPGTFEMAVQQDMNMKATIEVQGTTHKQDMDMSFLQASTLNVSAPDAGGNCNVVMRVTRFKQDMKGGPVRMSIDTDDPRSLESNPAGRVFKALVGAQLTTRFEKNRKAVSVIGADEVWDRLAGADPSAGPMIQQFQQQFGSEGMAQMLSQYTMLSPKKPVGVGAVWYPKLQMPIPGVGTVSQETKCKLAKLEKTDQGQIATIDMAAAITIESAGSLKMGPAAATFDVLDFTLNGHATVNVDTGLITEQVFDMEGSMAMTRKGQGGAASMSGALQGVTTTTIKPVP